MNQTVALKRRARRTVNYAKTAGWQQQCSCCGFRARTFLPAGVRRRPNAKCPRCGAVERHRATWIWLKERAEIETSRARLLHIAPESTIQPKLEAVRSLRYVTFDLFTAPIDVRGDITRLPFPDGSFDIVVCNHVLEHIVDDATAMREMHRVLAVGGWALLQVPMDSSRASTYEDPAITTPEARLEHFGQIDHVRIYGPDYVDRLSEAGFDVELDRYLFELDAHRVEREAVQVEDAHRCWKRE